MRRQADGRLFQIPMHSYLLCLLVIAQGHISPFLNPRVCKDGLAREAGIKSSRRGTILCSC